MWRPARGATNRPGPCRPTSGYGRILGRPGPRSDDSLLGDVTDDEPALGLVDPSPFGELVDDLLRAVRATEPRAVEQEAEAPAPVTP
jgi:hypothetical protein